ncbi:MAG: hypothetical protein GY820_39230 [Gammaproteobacteria bacterium]|nr:hypothetical protein [Gammaproteobacteria bacterium]
MKGGKNKLFDKPDVFRLEIAISDLLEDSDIEKMRKAFEITDDACDCCAKGMVIGQIFENSIGTHLLIEASFLNGDVAEKIKEFMEGVCE